MNTNKRIGRSLLLGATLLVLNGAALPALADPGHDHSHGAGYSAGEPGDAKKPARIVLVTMQEAQGKMIYIPNKVEVKKGEQVKFIINNAGLLTHEFVLASEEDNLKHAELMKKFPDMEHADPNSVTLQPGKKAELVWRFSKSGAFEFSCLIPGHREAGMIGGVAVK